MSRDSSLDSDVELDDWSDDDEDDQDIDRVQHLDSRRLVENKLDDLRLMRETSEYNFDL